jgi:hypothetical protein
MATRDEIKRTILEVAGNPDSGVVRQFADAWADAIVALDKREVTTVEVKETRVISPAESR